MRKKLKLLSAFLLMGIMVPAMWAAITESYDERTVDGQANVIKGLRVQAGVDLASIGTLTDNHDGTYTVTITEIVTGVNVTVDDFINIYTDDGSVSDVTDIQVTVTSGTFGESTNYFDTLQIATLDGTIHGSWTSQVSGSVYNESPMKLGLKYKPNYDATTGGLTQSVFTITITHQLGGGA